MRVAVLADMHSNLVAFQAVATDFGQVDQVWCLGDLVGYGPHPNECIELLGQWPHSCIAGNHDWAAVGRISTTAFNPDAAQACQWTAEQLSTKNRRLLYGLPTKLVLGDFTLAHGSPRDPIWEYLMTAAAAMDNSPYFSTPYCLVGHTHVPVVFRLDGQATARAPLYGHAVSLEGERLIINPGSVGQPRDGEPEARYLLLDTEALTCEYRRVAYDIARTQRTMLDLGLPVGLALRLSYGW